MGKKLIKTTNSADKCNNLGISDILEPIICLNLFSFLCTVLPFCPQISSWAFTLSIAFMIKTLYWTNL